MLKKIRLLKKEKEKLVYQLKNIQGQISDDELYELYLLAKEVKHNDCIVEIGAFRGKSTIALALGTKSAEKCTVYSIDPHENFIGVAGGSFGPIDLAKKYENIVKMGVGQFIKCICLPSEQVCKNWNRPIGLLWIDGDHKYESVLNDFLGFKTNLSEESFIVFHDNNMEDVKKAINDLAQGEEIKIAREIHRITIAKLFNSAAPPPLQNDKITDAHQY